MFRNYYDLDDIRLDLPIGDKTYTIPPITAAAGARLETGDDIADEEFVQLTLGTALEQLRADGVRPEAIVRAALTSLANHRDGRDVAIAMWETNALPERLAAYMAARSQNSPASPRSPSSATAGKTRSPAGTRATTSRQATPPKRRPAKKSPSPGRKSSASSTS